MTSLIEGQVKGPVITQEINTLHILKCIVQVISGCFGGRLVTLTPEEGVKK